MGAKEIKVVFACNSFDGTPLDGAVFVEKIGEKLKQHGIRITSVFTHFQEVKDYFSGKEIRCHYLPDLASRHKPMDLDKELSEIEDEYHVSVQRLLLGDYDQSRSDRRKAEETMLALFRFWEELVKKEKPDYVFGGGGVRFEDMIGYYVCEKHGTKYMVTQYPPFPGTFSFTRDIMGHNSYLDEYWSKNSEKEITAEEEEKAKAYVKSMTEGKKRPFQVDSKPRMSLGRLRYFLGRAYKSLFVERLRTPYSRPWRGAYAYGMRMMRAHLSERLFERPKANERFIFFPLHVEWDSTILVWNPAFIGQDFLIRIIANHLPHGMKLYVKAHINDIGGVPLSQLKEIKKTPHVRLIHPGEDSHRLIRNSEAVFVIAGTAGWEGILLRKPVIRAGKTFYDKLGMTFGAEEIGRMGEVIMEAITENRYDEKRLLRFIAAFQRISYPGRFYFTQLYYTNKSNRDEVLSDENITNLVEGMRRHMELESGATY